MDTDSGLRPIDPTKPMDPDKLPEPEDILEFWRAKGARVECELCGHIGWKVRNKKAVFSVLLPWWNWSIRDALSQGFLSGPVLLYLTCDNCAHVRLVHRGPVLAWLRNIQTDD